MKLIHITTKNNWIKIKESGWLKRPIDLGRMGSAIHKDRIFFFLLNDKTYAQDIKVLKQQMAEDKSIGDIGIDVIEYKACDMLAIELKDETFEPENIETQYIEERKIYSELVGSKINYYSIKDIISIDRLRVIDDI